ncbi:hypothetical protein AMATHDRAFT_188799 [Amanita thiersii Skay4041]|uniref:BHLH domain-containing protein n=1 Tax=Amanita thiersii Skay4041 TaxID=703135 RepID=A0A2A9NWL8_9AGAR|nr:hypothetical protein AMATHDRAFT_188799 [Amanita thiersii Skay4041]
MSDPRPSSPYVFGDATSHSAESNIQLRKLLRSPSLEHHDPQLTSPMSHPDTAETNISNENGTQDSAKPQSGVMTSDVDRISQQTADRRNNREGHHFNYSMRRHSIAAAQEIHGQPTAHTPHGTKRKMSGDRNGFAPVGEEIDPQLVGPGVPSVMEVDPEAPAPKRRGSAIDSRGLAQLSINERSTPWWSSGRRDSTSSLLSGNSTMGNYSPGAAGDGRLPGGMAAFAWPTNPQPVDPSAAPGVQNPSDPSVGMTRTFDPTIPMAMMSPGFSQDRRMSVPSALPSGQTRVLRSRSRPPSRQKQNGVTSTTTPSTNQEEAASNPPATTATKSVKESSTPYSRSPELRISHKLAERKRRKEMKDLFDELRDQLPADRGMKASKWEILSKAIDFVTQLKQSHQDMIREIEMLRHELDAIRQGIPPFPGGPPPHAVVYTQGPPVPGQYPPPPPGVLQHQPPPQPHPPLSRPSSSQNTFPPGAGPPTPNGAVERIEAPQP